MLAVQTASMIDCICPRPSPSTCEHPCISTAWRHLHRMRSSRGRPSRTCTWQVLTERKFQKSSTIIRQGTSTDAMYFVYSGRCRVLTQLDLTRGQKSRLSSSLYETRAAESASTIEHGEPRAMQADAPVLEIGELTKHQFFGEVALLESKRRGKKSWPHAASIVSTTRVELLVLSRYDFYHHISEETQDLMLQYGSKFYLTEDKIRSSIDKQHRWDSYKQELMGGRISGSPTSPTSPTRSPAPPWS